MKIDQLRQLCAKATPAPWNYGQWFGSATVYVRANPLAWGVDYRDDENAQFIVGMREHAEKLVNLASAARQHSCSGECEICVALAGLEGE